MSLSQAVPNSFWADPRWQGIGVALAVVSILATVMIYRLQRGRKSLAFGVISETPLLNRVPEDGGAVALVYEGRLVEFPWVVVLEVRNNGTMPITRSDFDRPLTFSFGEDVEVLSVRTADPYHLGVKLTVTTTSIIVDPLLFNARDSLSFTVVVNGESPKVTLMARIAGVSDIESIESQVSNQRTMVLAAVTGAFFNGGAFGVLALSMDRFPTWIQVLGISLVMSVNLLFQFVVFRSFNERR